MDDMARDVELAGVEADKILADQVDLDLALKVRADVSWSCFCHCDRSHAQAVC